MYKATIILAIFIAAIVIGQPRVRDDLRSEAVVAERLWNIQPSGAAYKATIIKLERFARDESIVIYEGLTPLGMGKFHLVKDRPFEGGIGGKEVIFSASDNSDPRTNGREYWAVLPRR